MRSHYHIQYFPVRTPIRSVTILMNEGIRYIHICSSILPIYNFEQTSSQLKPYLPLTLLISSLLFCHMSVSVTHICFFLLNIVIFLTSSWHSHPPQKLAKLLRITMTWEIVRDIKILNNTTQYYLIFHSIAQYHPIFFNIVQLMVNIVQDCSILFKQLFQLSLV